jgi:hypothetical protein
MMVDRAHYSHAIFLLEELIIHQKMCGSQRNLSLQGKLFHQGLIIMQLIADGLKSLVN